MILRYHYISLHFLVFLLFHLFLLFLFFTIVYRFGDNRENSFIHQILSDCSQIIQDSAFKDADDEDDDERDHEDDDDQRDDNDDDFDDDDDRDDDNRLGLLENLEGVTSTLAESP